MFGKNKAETFVYRGYFDDDIVMAGMDQDYFTKEELETGIYFAPESSLTFEVFEKEKNANDARFCVTMVYDKGSMVSWQDLSGDEVLKLIEKKKSKISGEDKVCVFKMDDGKSIASYFKEKKREEADPDGSRQVSFSLRLRDGSRYDHWTLVPNSITDQTEVEKYILDAMFNDKIFVDIEDDELAE